MTDRTYPYTAWVLQRSFAPKEVELVKEYRAFGGLDYGDITASGKFYATSELFKSKRDAVDAGWRRVDEQSMRVAKAGARLLKCKAALSKATAELGSDA